MSLFPLSVISIPLSSSVYPFPFYPYPFIPISLSLLRLAQSLYSYPFIPLNNILHCAKLYKYFANNIQYHSSLVIFWQLFCNFLTWTSFIYRFEFFHIRINIVSTFHKFCHVLCKYCANMQIFRKKFFPQIS